MPDWRITRLRGKYALTFEQNGKRHRYSLGTSDPRTAYSLAPSIYAELTRAKGLTITELWQSYCKDKEGFVVLETMFWTWKALQSRFGSLSPDQVTIEDCRAHIKARRLAGIGDGTIHTELGHLRTVLRWAEAHRLIAHAPVVERPQKPEPKNCFLTREEVHNIIAAASRPHIKAAIHLMVATAARVSAILELTWDRVDFERRQIILRNPDDKARRKGRAIVPMNATLFICLQELKQGALSDYVIEWAGSPLKSLKRGITTAAKVAGVPRVSAHVFRHTAAVWMAEAGIGMEEIAQYLGHKNTSITRNVYARYSPDYLQKAAKVLEIGLHALPEKQGKMQQKFTKPEERFV